ncbi:MAG: hypothetical protein AABX53_01335 [Nanoarchaeota archaeon]
MALSSTLDVWRSVFARPRSGILFVLIAFVFFTVNVVIKNYKTLVAITNDQGISAASSFLYTITLGFHHTVTPSSYTTMIIITVLTALLITLLVFRAEVAATKKVGVMSGLGIALGIVAPGCAACGVGLLALIGISGSALALLPFKGLELSIIAIGILYVAIYSLTQRLRSCDVCKINLGKNDERRKHYGRNKN